MFAALARCAQRWLKFAGARGVEQGLRFPLAFGLALAAYDGHDVLDTRRPSAVLEADEGQPNGGRKHRKTAAPTGTAPAVTGGMQRHRAAVEAVRQTHCTGRPNRGATQVVPLRTQKHSCQELHNNAFLHVRSLQTSRVKLHFHL